MFLPLNRLFHTITDRCTRAQKIVNLASFLEMTKNIVYRMLFINILLSVFTDQCLQCSNVEVITFLSSVLCFGKQFNTGVHKNFHFCVLCYGKQ